MAGTLYFLGSAALLLLGYFVYGAFIERVFGADASRPTPVQQRQDGVDFQKMPRYKIFLIQFLNIAGLGPVVGTILGALYGPAALLWVVFGSIFAGAVHDYCSAMMSLRSGGASYPELVGRSFGKYVRRFMDVFTIIFLIMAGSVFALGPAQLLASMTPCSLLFWSAVIFAYYFLATVMPIDMIIGRIYPYFGLLLLLTTLALAAALLVGDKPILPNLDFFTNVNPRGLPMWPLLFVTISCGAISGVHATQSPLMTRCVASEKDCRLLFYGPMIAEGLIGLIWVTLGLSFYESSEALQQVISTGSPMLVVKQVAMEMLGSVGGILAILGVIVLPISSGDTAFRAVRLLAADALQMDQRPVGRRLLLSVPFFAAGILLTQVDFGVIWRYFGWINQVMSSVTLWAISIYLARHGRLYWVSAIPGVFMTAVCVTYLCSAGIGLGMDMTISTAIGVAASFFCLLAFLKYIRGHRGE
ncbi:MAG: carbon starvation CstA family protein, partial [Desulfovibrionaceae bacterium]|nr:carbon starvation CstA family protein [Desulfovibrionaceae bacterium]